MNGLYCFYCPSQLAYSGGRSLLWQRFVCHHLRNSNSAQQCRMLGLSSHSREVLPPTVAQSIRSCVLYDTKMILTLLSNHVFSERKREENTSRPIISPCLQEVNEEYSPAASGDTSVLCWASVTLTSSALTRYQLSDCKCCILNRAVDLAGLLAPVRPRSTGVSPPAAFFAVDSAYGFWVSSSPSSREAVNKLVNLSSALSKCKVTPHLYFLLRFVF